MKRSLLISFLILMSFSQVHAETADGTAEKLAEDFQSTKISLMKDEVKQRQILGSLFEIGRQMKKIVSEKSQLEQEKLLVEANVKDLAEKIMELDQKTKTQKSLLRERLAAIYKLGGQGIARILFTSSSSAALERNLKILGIVAQKDIDLIKDYSKTSKDLEVRKKRLTLRWAHLKELEQKIQGKEQKLAEQDTQKNKILQGVKTSQKFAMMKLTQIRKKSKEIAKEDESGLLDLLFQPSFFEKKGQLPLPIHGHLAQGFGLMRDEVHNVVLSQKGQFYQAAEGSAVKAIFQGKIAFAGDVPGFGKTLIVDHGDHYYSVYSHNKALQVHVGDEVKQLQTLALSGHGDADLGDGLYFEIRHFSEPADPKLWLSTATAKM